MVDTRDTASTAASQGHTFVCYARHDELFVLRVASAMRDRGVRIWIDQWGIQPGDDWNKSIDGALKTCQTFLIVLSPEAVASDEVRGELRAALNGHKRIIPVLYRPCEIPTRLLLTQYLDFTRSSDLTDASLDHLAGVLRGDETPREVVPRPASDTGSRQTLLEDVSGEASDRLRSIGTERPLPILFERQPHQVERAWDAEVGVAARRPPEPHSADITEAFDDAAIGGKLLILGGPGSGKTTALLQILRELAGRAALDDSHAVPVLVSLVSWKTDQAIGEWLVDELKVKHGVRADLGVRWRDERRIAPLLDGLDELPAERQRACVDAINLFQQAYRPPFLVVCCRLAEDQNLTVKLRLRGAVCLLPLDADQIGAYLAQAGHSELSTAVLGDPALMEMARSPLLLSFMSAQPAAPDVQRWQDAPSASDRRQRVFDTYLSSHVSSGRDGQPVSGRQMVQWLGQLATILEKQDQSEFLIERMQPEWLDRSRLRWAYRAGVLVFSTTVVAIVVQATLSLFAFVPRGDVGLALEARLPSVYGEESAVNTPLHLLVAVVLGAIIASRKRVVPVETVTWSWSRATANALSWGRTAALAGLDYGTLLGVTCGLGWLLWSVDLSGRASQQAGEVAGMAGAVLAAVLLARVKPSGWRRQARLPGNRVRMLDALAAAILWALALGWILLWGTERASLPPLLLAVLLSGMALFAMLGFSALMTEGVHRLLIQALLVGLISGAAIGAMSNVTVPHTMTTIGWLRFWTTSGISVGVLSGMALALARRSGWMRSTRAGAVVGLPGSWRSWMGMTIGALVIAGAFVGIAAAVSAWNGGNQVFRGTAGFVESVRTTLINALVVLTLAGVSTAIAAAGTAGALGLLAGALGGAAGLDVERRLVPNQGIRQSAVNVLVFSGLGILIVGVPYGLFNLTVVALVAWALPSPFDVIRFAIAAGATFGILAGLIPGAACIQHLVLRVVLWADGRLPLRLARFLDVATRQRILQRVGGRYRFIHVLLRDYLAEATRARTPA